MGKEKTQPEVGSSRLWEQLPAGALTLRVPWVCPPILLVNEMENRGCSVPGGLH